MLTLSIHQRYYLYRKSVDIRKSFDGLSGLIRDQMKGDPLSGDVFIFINRRRNRIKLLCWDKDGFILFYKRLERGTFEWPVGTQSDISIEVLSCMLYGIKLSSVHKRKRYVHAA
jgi:transposase